MDSEECDSNAAITNRVSQLMREQERSRDRYGRRIKIILLMCTFVLVQWCSRDRIGLRF